MNDTDDVCWRCDGRGLVWWILMWKTCPDCGGTGQEP